MSRNGAGVYSATVSGGTYPASSNTLIEAAKFNTLIADMATALTESIARDGQTTITANIPMSTFKITGLGAGTAATDAARLGQVQDGSSQWCGTAGGTADALTLTPTPAITAYAAGQRFVFKSGAAVNTGAATINVSGVGDIAIQANGAALAAGAIEADQWYEIILSSATVAQISKIGALSSAVNNITLTGAVINEAEGAAVASASTIDLDAATGNFLHITGTTTITAITLAQGAERTVVFDGVLTFTHGASLILPTAANITTAAGDVAILRGEGSGVTRCIAFNRADGTPLVESNIQIFTSSGTWTKPSSGTYAEVILIGGGGGGGSGEKNLTISNPGGGSGGGGGGLTRWIFPLSQLSATESVTIGAGGTGGASVSANTTTGNDGTAGGNTTFNTLKAGGGAKGLGGPGSGGAAGTGLYAGSAGGGSGANASASGLAGAGGGGGGGYNGSYQSGGDGGDSGSSIFSTLFAGGTGGNTTTTVATAGTSVTTNEPNGGGGGGGGGCSTGTAAVRTGAAGGSYGGGGGGGAAGINSTFNSGAGGDGAIGFCVVFVY